jgi:ATP-dependent DNA helicase DinG
MRTGNLTRALDKAVTISTEGNATTARPAQLELAEAVHHIMSNGGQFAAEAPTGSGKSLAVLVPAMFSACAEERTVISTETKNLQKQLLTKDGPAAVGATKETRGRRPVIAVLKGWANYGCLLAANAISTKDSDEEQELAKWVLSQAKNSKTGDMADCDLGSGLSEEEWKKMWEKVSVQKDECAKESCRFVDSCLSRTARERAGKADIVVVNHTFLALQAAYGFHAVVGNSHLGPFHHLIIDEAHSLPETVRNMTSELSARTLSRVVGSLEECRLDILRGAELNRTGANQDLGRLDALRGAATTGADLADELGQELESLIRPHVLHETDEETSVAINDGARLFDDLAEQVKAWVEATQNEIGAVKRALLGQSDISFKDLTGVDIANKEKKDKLILSLSRANGRLTSLVSAINRAYDTTLARWFSYKEANYNNKKNRFDIIGAKLVTSPVDTGPFIKYNIFDAEQAVKDEGAGERTHVTSYLNHNSTHLSGYGGCTGTSDDVLKLRSVIAISGTLPKLLVSALGMDSRCYKRYGSSFTDAYARSLLYIPKLEASLPLPLNPVCNGGGFDLGAHPKWAVNIIHQLIDANNGSALVLVTKKETGLSYVDELRSRLSGLKIYSQWEGQRDASINMWRADVGSVLVGTRSLMTGVDAPGATCTLVIIDRVPRAAQNPIDDARRDTLAAKLNLDRWGADRLVYVADAALLLEQASGRLVRSTSDSGMVAVLDPRLRKGGKISYKEKDRLMYKSALGKFPYTTDLERALVYLRGGHLALPA